MATALMTAPRPTSAGPDALAARPWVDDLRAEGARGQAAVADLHALLLKAGRGAEDAELFAALREEIGRLGERQREVLVAVALNGVPIDVLAERLGSTRGALYKNLHDARRNLRAALATRGFRVGVDGEEEA